MAKVEIDILKKLLERNDVDVRKRNQLLQDIKHVLEQEALEKDMKPKTPKKEFQLLILDPKRILKGKEDQLCALILQTNEGTAPEAFISSLTKAAYEHNASPKGRKFPVENLAEACEAVSPKIFKEHGLSVKTKIAIRLTCHDGKLPKAPGLPD